jgi:uncharacterized linocin/CFP29 family protein
VDLLKRNLAPITPEAWEQIDAEAQRVLRLNLAGRKLVDFDGPHGWQYAALNLGRLEIKSDTALGVPWGLRRVQPVIELRVPIELTIAEMDDASRGAAIDLGPVVSAAEKVAAAEDRVVFSGFKPGEVDGLIPASPHEPLTIPDDFAEYPSIVVAALNVLRRAGIDGPYALALGPECYAGLARAAEDGYPIRERVRRVLDGPMVWAPQVDGAVLLSTRGGDYTLTVGQDLSIGYAGHDHKKVTLFLTESFTFHVRERAAAVHLRPKRGKK